MDGYGSLCVLSVSVGVYGCLGGYGCVSVPGDL